MRIWSLAFLLGVVLLQFFTQLLAKNFIFLIIPAAILSYWRAWRLPAAIVIGWVWALVFAHGQWDARLPDDLQGQTVTLTGYIASLPQAVEHGTTFLFQLKKFNDKPASSYVHLQWMNCHAHLHAGDEWRFQARLKKPYGMLNPGGFDYEAFVVQANIIANGYIDDKAKNQLLAQHHYRFALLRLRQLLLEKITSVLPKTKTSEWIYALAIGERQAISPDDWQVLRNTGTNHLMAIAGLHIGFLALVAHVVVARLWRYVPWLTYRLPAVHAGAIAALVMAFLYSALAGFSLPTQRACSMLMTFLLFLLWRKQIAAWQAWSSALLIVLLLNPLSVLTESFWLSFGSVALIIYGIGGRLAPSGWWWKLGRIQWVIAVGLIPLSIALFQQCSLISFVANSIAIPWVGFIVAPLSFLGTLVLLVSTTVGGWILICADKMLSYLWVLLSWFAHLSHVVWYQHIPAPWMLVAAIISVVLLLLPIGFPGRYFSIIFILPLLFFKPSVPKAGEAWLTLLDVGQGLAAVVQTQNHILIYDTGPRLSMNYDMGESVVVPFLHFLQTAKIDMLVVSHGDNDHSGGAKAVLQQFPVTKIKTSAPELFTHAEYCLQGDTWQWDGVNFEFLSPNQELLDLDNDSSCVLRITAGEKHILFTGDIEKLAEKNLVENSLTDLPATILIAPHHGSKTSANEKFIAGVHPEVVLFPVGYRNRYHFPNFSVVQKYEAINAKLFTTAASGAIQSKLSTATPLTLNFYRAEHKRWWNN